MNGANRNTLCLMDRILIGALLFLAMLLLGIGAARAGEIVPSVGLTRSTSDGDLKAFAGLALRGSVLPLPLVQSEIGVAYRSESRFDDNLDVKMWPVTASLWLKPIPLLYFGGGVGWYHTTYDYEDGLGIEDDTSEEFGTHLGGGVKFPIVPPIASLDVNGRYVKLKDKDSPITGTEFGQSFWSTAVGVAIKF